MKLLNLVTNLGSDNFAISCVKVLFCIETYICKTKTMAFESRPVIKKNSLSGKIPF